MPVRMHKNEIPTDAVLARRLVDRAFPQYADQPVRELGASGSTNVQFHLGDDLLIRLPRQQGGGATIATEFRWTELVGEALPVAVPGLVGVGDPAYDYPEPWALVRWLPGEHPPIVTRPERPPGDEPSAAQSNQFARDLAAIVLALRRLDPVPEAFSDPGLRTHYRGRPLAEHDAQFRQNIDYCRALRGLDLDLEAALGVWEDALGLPGVQPEAARWLHSDIVAENLLLVNGRLSALLDFGGLGIGDPTVDLHGAWELLDPFAREVFRNAVGVDDAEWLRGRAWALAIAIMTFPYYWNTMPGRIRDRLAMARAVLADPIKG